MIPRPSRPLRRVRPFVYLILFFFSWTNLGIYHIVYAATKDGSQKGKIGSQEKDERYGKGLAEMREILEQVERKGKEGKGIEDEVKLVRAKKQDLEAIEAEVDAEFAAVETHLKEKNLPPEILQRHQAAIAEFKARQAELKHKLQALEADDDAKDKEARSAALQDLAEFMKANQKKKTHTPTDPNKLPFLTPDGKVRKPIESEKEFRASLFKPKTIKLAGPIPSGLTLPAITLPALPNADDVAETEDVTLTPAIHAKAEELQKNPVKIYHWVRNTIEFIPTYGSIQGADMTLQTKRGNAFDTASLLIGLLRASNIPARYVYGTIQVPSEQVMNWVGGVTKPEAAQQLLGQGGIPNIVGISGGMIKYFKLEHVWVEAWIDYVPSRGAVNREGDTWVPLDASFKQYTYTQGMDLKSAVPFDAQTFLNQATSGATVNDTEGWVQNLNDTAIQTALTDYQAQVQNYINSTKPDATMGDVLGSKKIVEQNRPSLMGTLPYKTIATGGKFTGVPDPLRHQFRYSLYASAVDRAMDSPLFRFTESLPRLAGKKITLSFVPATQADADLIASYLPKPHADGSPISPSEFPTSLPGYLIRLTAELRVDGELVASAGTFTMGQELVSAMGLFDPANGWEYGEDNHPIAGEYIATHVDLQGVSQAQIQSLRDKLTAMKTKLETSQFAGLTKEDVSGDLLYSAILAYFAVNKTAGQISSQAANVVEYRKPSFGSFFATAQPVYWFGVPKNVRFPGLTMDVDWYMTMAAAKDNSSTVGYMQQSGMRLSAYEHLIPEQLFSSAQNPGEGISAVKALSVAASQGQRIYTITGQNVSSVLPMLTIGEEVKQEIRNAVAAGKTVAVSQGNVTVSGWTGVGYIITDPTTGAGAYKISGGANGADIIIAIIGIVSITISLVPFVLMTAWFGLIYIAILTAVIYAIVFCELQGLPNPTAADLSNIVWSIVWAAALAGFKISFQTSLFISIITSGLQNHVCRLIEEEWYTYPGFRHA